MCVTFLISYACYSISCLFHSISFKRDFFDQSVLDIHDQLPVFFFLLWLGVRGTDVDFSPYQLVHEVVNNGHDLHSIGFTADSKSSLPNLFFNY